MTPAPAMDILGLGVAGGFGCGLDDLRAALSGRGPQPLTRTLALPQGPGLIAELRADLGPLEGRFPKRALRRLDRFSQLALLGASQALEDAGLSLEEPGTVGLILATGHGAAGRNFAFTDSVAEHGDALASPLLFSSSVANAAAANVSILLGATGPGLTVCQEELCLASALLSAQAWLAEGRVDLVLLGGVDARDDFLSYCERRLAGPDYLIGEGAAFFALRRAGEPPPSRGRIRAIRMGRAGSPGPEIPGDALLFISGRDLPRGDPPTHGRVFGRFPSAQAMDLAAAALSLRDARVYTDCGVEPLSLPGSIACLALDSMGGWGLILLEGA